MESKIRRHFDEIITAARSFLKGYIEHLNEPIPHSHGKGKKTIELTDEMEAREFFEKIKSFKKKYGKLSSGISDSFNISIGH